MHTDNQVTVRDQLSEMAAMHLGIVEKNNFDGALNSGNAEGAKRILAIAIAQRLRRPNVSDEYKDEARSALVVIGFTVNEANELQIRANA